LNKNLPVVDLTNNGANVSKSSPAAISVTSTKVTSGMTGDSSQAPASASGNSSATQMNSLAPGN
jgi:hypothetical protein